MSLVQLLPTEDVSSHLITATTTVGGGGGPGSADHTVHRAAGCTTDRGPSRLDPRQARHAAERSGVLTPPGALDLSRRSLSSLRKQKSREAPASKVTFAGRLAHMGRLPAVSLQGCSIDVPSVNQAASATQSSGTCSLQT